MTLFRFFWRNHKGWEVKVGVVPSEPAAYNQASPQNCSDFWNRLQRLCRLGS